MSPRASISSKTLRRALALIGCGWPWAAMACAAVAPGDADRLSSLSTGQLSALCAEIDPEWAGAGGLLACDNGWTLYLDSEGLAACGSQTTVCSATVGAWRACMRALFADACQVPEQEPVECVALRSQPGCSELALPLLSECTPLTEQYAAASTGLYEITSRLRNDVDCSAERAEALPAEGHLALLAGRSPGTPGSPLQGGPALTPHSCTGLEQCRQLVAELLGSSDPYLWLSSGSNAGLPDGFRCGPDSSGTLRDSVVLEVTGRECIRTTFEVSLRLGPDASLELHFQTFDLRLPAAGEPCFATVGPEERGTCVSSDVRRAQRVAPL